MLVVMGTWLCDYIHTTKEERDKSFTAKEEAVLLDLVEEYKEENENKNLVAWISLLRYI